MTILELFKLLRKHIKLTVALPIIFAILVGAYSFIFIPNQYTASVSMYVLVSSNTSENQITNSDLSASQMLTNDVATLIKSSRVCNDTARALGMQTLDGYTISINTTTTTRVITVSVRGQSPVDVAIVANELANQTDVIAQSIMDVKSVNVIDQAVEPTDPSGPPRALYTLVAFLAGLLVAVAIAVLLDMVNTRVRTPDEAGELLGLPVIGRIPMIKD